MASRATQALTAGIKVLGGTNSPTYTLEFLTSATGHPLGSFETIVVPFILIGRDKKCQVLFDDDVPTVSRKHASIERVGTNYTIKNLSQINPTLINDEVIDQPSILKNGDEIQLSLEGPRFRFNESVKGTSKMGFTKRMNLVMKQAIKPYKVVAISSVLLLLVFGFVGAYFISDLTRKNKEQKLYLTELQKKDSLNIAAYNSQLENAIQSYTEKLDSSNKASGGVIQTLNKKVQKLESGKAKEVIQVKPEAGNPVGLAYRRFKDDIYFLETTSAIAKLPGGEEIDLAKELNYSWTGTGFLLRDGRFVTARHCIQGWRYLLNDESLANLYVNSLETQHQAKIIITFKATSPNNSFSFKNDQFSFNDQADNVIDVQTPEGEVIQLRMAELNNTDWAVMKTSYKSNLDFDKEMSMNIQAGEPVVVLGYSYGLGGTSESPGKISPLLSESTIARDGLNSSGNIDLTNRNFGTGNSGGPVLCKIQDDYKVIGIVSAGLGSEIGFIVPINVLE
ncbi:hypothetical protein BH23BAC1_BH23BAC1_25470 [soil metagenome]